MWTRKLVSDTFRKRLCGFGKNIRNVSCAVSDPVSSVFDEEDTFGQLYEESRRKKKKPRKTPANAGFPITAESPKKIRSAASSSNSLEIQRKKQFRTRTQTYDRSSDQFGLIGKQTDHSEQIFNLEAERRTQRRKLPGIAEERKELRRKEEMEPDFSDSDDDDIVEVVSPVVGKKRDPFWYVDKCEALVKENKLAECVAMLEKRMIKEDRVHPICENFQVVLGALGRAGCCRKAFEIFSLMKRKNVDPKKYTYTSLWNACFNSQNSELALEKAKGLLESLDRKGVCLERPHYHVLIKVFGKHGDLEFAFKIMDRMIRDGFVPDAETYAHLLQVCISERDAGFKLAIEVWRKMMVQGCRPNLSTFNLLLRACRDCGLGSSEFANELLSNVLPPLSRPKSKKKDVVQVLSVGTESLDPVWRSISAAVTAYRPRVDEVRLVSKYQKSPDASASTDVDFEKNLLNPRFRSEEIVSLAETSKPDEKFLLVGGVRGILTLMRRNYVNPDIKTFTEMLELIPETVKSEEALLSYMDWFGVKGDVDFFNLMLRKRCRRLDREAALSLLSTFRDRNLVPNIRTFGCLAVNCYSRVDAIKMLNDLKTLDLKPNRVVLGALVKAALRRKNFWYALDMLKEMRNLGIKPDQALLGIMEFRINQAREAFVQAELSDVEEGEGYLTNELVQEGFSAFKDFYSKWIRVTELDQDEDKDRTLHEKVEAIDTDDLRDPWDKPWATHQPKYQ